jgi:hypothetical protein
MYPLIGFFSVSSVIELELLGAAFVLCSLIGIERQIRQKSAGYRTHVLVGIGACGFTLISAYGFDIILNQEISLDPSRIAAQIVSGISFIGAGVIFIRYRDGGGVLRSILSLAADMGYTTAVRQSDRVSENGSAHVSIEVRFVGRRPLGDFMPPLLEIAGVEHVALVDTRMRRDDDERD